MITPCPMGCGRNSHFGKRCKLCFLGLREKMKPGRKPKETPAWIYNNQTYQRVKPENSEK